eukprot:2202606-Alexandrium_andersonii.AAC.1
MSAQFQQEPATPTLRSAKGTRGCPTRAASAARKSRATPRSDTALGTTLGHPSKYHFLTLRSAG